MAYGALLQADGGNLSGDNYRITIYENAFAGSVITATLEASLFDLRYQPTTDDISSRLCPSVLDFYIIQDSQSIEDIIADVLEYQQSNQYLVLVERDTGAGYYDYWRGILLQDQIQIIDQSNPTVIQFTALDGLAYLQTVKYDFNNTENTTEPLHTKVIDIIRNALSKGISTDFWGSSDNYLVTSVNWWEDDQTYGLLLDPLDTQLFDIRAWVKRVDRNDNFLELEFLSCFEVLTQIAKTYLSRIYMANGHYVFEQIPLRSTQNVKQVFYDKSGTQLTAGLINLGQTISQDVDGARLAKNVFNYFPALKSVSVEMDAYGSNFENLASLPTIGYTASTVKEYGYFDQSIGNIIAVGNVVQSFVINSDFNVSVDYDYSASDVISYGPSAVLGYVGIRPIFTCQIKLNDLNSATDYYFDGSNWVTSVTSFIIIGASKLINVPVLNSGTIRLRPADNVTQRIQTPPIPATGNVTVTMSTYRLQKLTALPNTYTSITPFSVVNPSNWLGQIDFTLSTFFDRGNTVRIITIENSNANIADNQIYDYGKLEIRDGSLQTGSIIIEPTAGNFEACNNWRIGNGTEDIALGALLVKQRLEIQKQVIQRYDGTVMTGLGYMYAIVFDSTLWIATNYSFNAGSNRVNGSWYKIGVTTEGTNVATERNPILTNFAIGSNGFFKFAGVNTLGNLNFGPNIFGGLVLDDGQIVSPQPYLMATGQRNNYVLVDASAGSSNSLDVDSTIVLYTWSGGNGAHDTEIPDPSTMDGGLIELRLDGSFTTGDNISVTPAAGLIRGAAELEINGANSVVFLRALNGNWY